MALTFPAECLLLGPSSYLLTNPEVRTPSLKEVHHRDFGLTLVEGMGQVEISLSQKKI